MILELKLKPILTAYGLGIPSTNTTKETTNNKRFQNSNNRLNIEDIRQYNTENRYSSAVTLTLIRHHVINRESVDNVITTYSFNNHLSKQQSRYK